MSSSALAPETIVAQLEAAGATLMALPAHGCFPAAFPTASLSHLIPSEAPRTRWSRPSAAAVSAMDRAYGWVRLLPCVTSLDVERRRLVLMRSLVWPDSEREDPHVWSWRRLAHNFGHGDHTIKRRHAIGIDMIASRIAAVPPSCRATLDRIRTADARSRNDARDALVADRW